MSGSFEFLSSAKEWEDSCRGSDTANIDRIPDAFKPKTGTAWTYPAQLLATLKAWKDLASLAQNGGERGLVKGYPAIVDKCSTESSKSGAWTNLTDPKPELLDRLPQGCVLLRFDFTLESPFYSRDDMPFYPTDNALKRHKVLDAPYLAASGIKGLLRWASRMRRASLQDDDSDVFLFGSMREGSAEDDGGPAGTAGMLFCYPLFFSGGLLGLETINPQDRETGAGSVPVKYEVVRPGAKGRLHFLLASLPGREKLSWKHAEAFIDDVAFLLSSGGLSAKSSAGWGMAKLDKAVFSMRSSRRDALLKKDGPSPAEQVQEAGKAPSKAPSAPQLAMPPREAFEAARKEVSDASGNLLNPFKKKKGNAKLYSSETCRVLAFRPEGWKPRNQKEREAEFKTLQERWQHVRKPYEEVEAWLREEIARLAAEASADAEALAAKQAEKARKAEEERRAAEERERKALEEKLKTKWSDGYGDFASLKQAMADNGRLEA